MEYYVTNVTKCKFCIHQPRKTNVLKTKVPNSTVVQLYWIQCSQLCYVFVRPGMRVNRSTESSGLSGRHRTSIFNTIPNPGPEHQRLLEIPNCINETRNLCYDEVESFRLHFLVTMSNGSSKYEGTIDYYLPIKRYSKARTRYNIWNGLSGFYDKIKYLQFWKWN